MTEAVWDSSWLKTDVTQMTMQAWRGVEAQHVISTMRLVDTGEEQDVLEQMLERSKPQLPEMKSPKHYLLSTPFRYRPQHQSRFRRAGTLGVWYGAEKLVAACAEVAYWRHRFILDSVPLLQSELLTEHTFFQAEVTGRVVDLMSPPWDKARATWTHGSDYAETQSVASAAKDMGVQWICYESVRASGNRCAAVLDVDALEMVAQGTTQQTWHCKATRESVTMVHQAERYDWTF
jgi:hypothetical protein